MAIEDPYSEVEALEVVIRSALAQGDTLILQDNAGPQATVTIDRDAASRLGVSTQAIDAALNNAFSQRQISTIYTQRNQYKVVLEVDPKLQTAPSMLDRIFVGSTTGAQIPLGSVAHIARTTAPVAVRHQAHQEEPGDQHERWPHLTGGRPRLGPGRGPGHERRLVLPADRDRSRRDRAAIEEGGGLVHDALHARQGPQ